MIIGGAPKSGTTALYYYLRQHPGFCLSEKKELHFFSRLSLERSVGGPGDRFVLAEIPKSFEEYLSYFNQCDDHQMAVDISPSYLFHLETAERIYDHLPDARIVFILRNPVEKAFSQYTHLVGAGRESLAFEVAIEKEKDRQRQGFADMWLYRESGFYSKALGNYLKIFGSDSVRVFFYGEFLNEPARVLREICIFTGVDPNFPFQPVSGVNRSGSPKSILAAKLFLAPNALTYFLRRIVPQGIGRSVRKVVQDWNTGAKPALPEDIRASLLDGYRHDILSVEQLVGRPSGWI